VKLLRERSALQPVATVGDPLPGSH
jgi:hypothetical protein